MFRNISFVTGPQGCKNGEGGGKKEMAIFKPIMMALSLLEAEPAPQLKNGLLKGLSITVAILFPAMVAFYFCFYFKIVVEYCFRNITV